MMSWNRIAPLLLAGMVLTVLGDLLFFSDGVVASYRTGDIARYFVFARELGYRELADGNLALWNPHVFSGIPFLGSFQPALLYPPNLVHLLVPVWHGVNLELALHVLLLAVSSFAWARGKGLSGPGALLTASIVAFGATASLRVLAGALSVLESYAWVPLLLAAIDRLAQRPNLGAGLLASLSATMILLAGYPPVALMTLIAVTLYCVPALAASAERGRLLASLVGAACLALLLSGMQLGAGLEMARESIREEGVSFAFASSFSFPPENLLTLFVPQLFGQLGPETLHYNGRWWYWDASAYIGTGACVLACAGAVSGRAGRNSALALTVFFILLAMGSYTPLYGWLYGALPGFDLLRGPSKFMFFATLFLALLAGMGLDGLLREASRNGPGPDRSLLALGAAVAGGLVLAAAWWIEVPLELLAGLELGGLVDPASRDFQHWLGFARQSAATSGATFLLVALLVFASRFRGWPVWLLLCVCVLELVSFARANRGEARIGSRQQHTRMQEAGEGRPGRPRILEDRATNFQMRKGGYSVWGYEPMVLSRYARFMARAQGVPLAELDNVMGTQPTVHDPLLRLVRGRYSRRFGTRGSEGIVEHEGALPHFVFATRYQVVAGPEQALDAVQRGGFDPLHEVVLESEPDPVPAAEPARANVSLVAATTDTLVLEVDLDRAAILVVTDVYARGWRAVALAGSVQQHYRVQPANAVLRGIALAAGSHRLRLEYSPLGYRVGRVATAAGLGLALIASVGWWWGSRGRASRGPLGDSG